MLTRRAVTRRYPWQAIQLALSSGCAAMGYLDVSHLDNLDMPPGMPPDVPSQYCTARQTSHDWQQRTMIQRSLSSNGKINQRFVCQWLDFLTFNKHDDNACIAANAKWMNNCHTNIVSSWPLLCWTAKLFFKAQSTSKQWRLSSLPIFLLAQSIMNHVQVPSCTISTCLTCFVASFQGSVLRLAKLHQAVGFVTFALAHQASIYGRCTNLSHPPSVWVFSLCLASVFLLGCYWRIRCTDTDESGRLFATQRRLHLWLAIGWSSLLWLYSTMLPLSLLLLLPL